MGRPNGYGYTVDTGETCAVNAIKLSDSVIWTACEFKVENPLMTLQDLEDNVTCNECRKELGFEVI